MRQNEPNETWVVYRNNHKALPSNAMCTQSEWERLERKEPGVHAVIRAGVENEGEAEKLARGTSGDPVVRIGRPKPRRQVVAPDTSSVAAAQAPEAPACAGTILEDCPTPPYEDIHFEREAQAEVPAI